MICIGFTGSRNGMTEAQKQELTATLMKIIADRSIIFRHGDCIGADAEAHDIATAVGCTVIIHPPLDNKHRAYCKTHECNIMTPKHYIDRNHDIVDSSELMIAAPETLISPENLRGKGTWSTINYALGKSATMILTP